MLSLYGFDSPSLCNTSGIAPMDFVANLRGHIARSSRASFGGWGLPNREKSIARSRPIAATMREQPNVKQQITTQRFAI